MISLSETGNSIAGTFYAILMDTFKEVWLGILVISSLRKDWYKKILLVYGDNCLSCKAVYNLVENNLQMMTTFNMSPPMDETATQITLCSFNWPLI